MADRSPEGRLEIAGGCLRFLHQCNWKMFVENLNDTMHPMVVHESSAGTAKRMWIDKPADQPKPMAIEQFTPFMSDYKFFDDMGVRVFDNGHSFSGVHFSIHSKYSAIAGYDEAMKAAYGEERAPRSWVARHNTVYYPNLTIKGAIQAIRVVRPIAVDKTVIESWTFRLDGAPAELLAAHGDVQPPDQLAVLGRRPRRPAGLPRHPGGPARRAATRGSACTATSTRRDRPGRRHRRPAPARSRCATSTAPGRAT